MAEKPNPFLLPSQQFAGRGIDDLNRMDKQAGLSQDFIAPWEQEQGVHPMSPEAHPVSVRTVVTISSVLLSSCKLILVSRWAISPNGPIAVSLATFTFPTLTSGVIVSRYPVHIEVSEKIKGNV